MMFYPEINKKKSHQCESSFRRFIYYKILNDGIETFQAYILQSIDKNLKIYIYSIYQIFAIEHLNKKHQ